MGRGPLSIYACSLAPQTIQFKLVPVSLYVLTVLGRIGELESMRNGYFFTEMQPDVVKFYRLSTEEVERERSMQDDGR